MKFLKKGQISVQTIFFILMSIFMVWIIYFGITKMFIVKDTLSEENRLQIKSDLINGFKYCEDPLNKGSYNIVDIKSNKINGVCILNKDILSNTNPYHKLKDLVTLYDSGENVILVKANIYSNNKIKDLFIVDKFKIKENLGLTKCTFKKDNQILKIKIPCN